MKVFPVLLVCLFVGSCSLKVFQEKVPKPLKKSEQHKEKERQGIYWLADNVEKPEGAKSLAVVLSSSVGLPRNFESNASTIKKGLAHAIGEHQKKHDEQQEKLSEFSGKKIEGTGINILPALSSVGFVALIALCIFCPALITVGAFLFRRMSGALKAIVRTIDEHSFTEPQEASALKQKLSANMDKAHKKLIEALRHG